MGCAFGVGIRQDEDELVAPQAAERIFVAHRVAETFGELDQQFVADPVPERIVDLLETVDIEEDQRQRLAPPLGTAQVMVDALFKQAAVGQKGQRIESEPDAGCALRPPSAG
jgi:hypothetical protein